MDDTDIGRHVTVRNAIVDKNCVIEDEVEIGVDPDFDKKHFTVTPAGRVIVPKWTRIKSDGTVKCLEGPYTSKEEEPPHASEI